MRLTAPVQNDLFASFFCTACALAQENRSLHLRRDREALAKMSSTTTAPHLHDTATVSHDQIETCSASVSEGDVEGDVEGASVRSKGSEAAAPLNTIEM
jgi:hypothetical protein